MNNKKVIITNPYSLLGRTVLHDFFTDDKKGEVIFPIIDEYYIKQFCKSKEFSIKEFFDSVHSCRMFYNISENSSIEDICGLIAIQMYATSKMETADGFSLSNFRNRICDYDVLNIDVGDWQKWAVDNQDNIWKKYYSWCHNNSFIITNECQPSVKKNRYVKYPEIHSSLILNRQDLKSIAYLFVEKGLNPNEDLSKSEFLSCIGIQHEKSYYTRRSIRIFTADRFFANEQIYQYYLSWNGDYLKPTYNGGSEDSKLSISQYRINLYYEFDKWFIDVLSIDTGALVDEIQLKPGLTFDFLKSYYCMKRSNVIVFQKDPHYDNFWEETRYIDDRNIEALLLEYVGNGTRYSCRNVVASIGLFRIVRINSESELYENFYGEERPYSFVGGFKISSNKYLIGAPPILKTEGKLTFWIDGARCDTNNEQQTHTFNLEKGLHQIKIRGYKTKEFTLVDVDTNISSWNDCNKWILQNKQPFYWQIHNKGVAIGLDFSGYSSLTTIPPLRKWCSNILYDENQRNIERVIKGHKK